MRDRCGATKCRRRAELRGDLRAAKRAAARTAGELVAIKLDAAGFEQRARAFGLSPQEVERMAPRELSWRAAAAFAQRLINRVR